MNKREKIKKDHNTFVDKVKKLAYSKWELAEKPEGQSDYFWYEAQKEIRLQLSKSINSNHCDCDVFDERIYSALLE